MAWAGPRSHTRARPGHDLRYSESVTATPRSEETIDHDGSAVILMDARGRVLLQQRDDDIPPAGYGRWTVPGGRREGEETPRQTALREFAEETGLKLERLRFWRVASSATFPGQLASTLPVFFADDPVDEAAIEVNEGLDFRFWAPGEALALLMNPWTRDLLEAFFASDQYRGTLAAKRAYKQGVAVLAMDRWGRVLLQLRDEDLPPERSPGVWSLPGGLIEPDEAPDAAALREFEEETGQLLEELKLYRAFRHADLATLLVDVQHVYYCDPDIPEDLIDVREGQAFRYWGPGDLATLPMPPHARTIMEWFFESPAYKGLFH